MILYDKEGELICGVCGDHWSAHSIGGNCNKLPVTPEQAEVLRRVYSTQPPKPKIQTIINSN